MSYLVERTDQGGGYLANMPSEHSYTHRVENAQVFTSRQAALSECCENERPVALSEILKDWATR